MQIFFEVLAALFVVKKCTEIPIIESTTIGETKVVDGIEYYNVGTMYNEDDWIRIGKQVIPYYINVYREDGEVVMKIEKERSYRAFAYIECDDLTPAERRIELLKKMDFTRGEDSFHYSGK